MKNAASVVAASMIGSALTFAIMAMGAWQPQPTTPTPANTKSSEDAVDRLYDQMFFMEGMGRPEDSSPIAGDYDKELARRKAIGKTYDPKTDHSEEKNAFDQLVKEERLFEFDRDLRSDILQSTRGIQPQMVACAKDGFVVILAKSGDCFMVAQDGVAHKVICRNNDGMLTNVDMMVGVESSYSRLKNWERQTKRDEDAENQAQNRP